MFVRKTNRTSKIQRISKHTYDETKIKLGTAGCPNLRKMFFDDATTHIFAIPLSDSDVRSEQDLCECLLR